MESVRIILLCMFSAVLYGIVHDQVTARICVEYFTIGHPPIFHSDNPTILGLGWGILATWWVGLCLGIALAVAARAGRQARRSMRSLVRPIITLVVVSAACALVAGSIGWMLARSGSIGLIALVPSRVPPSKHAVFVADFCAHLASYVAGFVGGAYIIARIAWLRFLCRRNSP